MTDDEAAPGETVVAFARPYPNPGTPHGNGRLRRRRAVLPSRLEVIDLLGRRVAAPLDALPDRQGAYEANLDLARLSAGTYILRLTTASGVQTQKLSIVR